MRSILGLLLMLLGLGVGVHAYFPDTLEKHVHFTKVSRILTPTSHRTLDTNAIEPVARTFSPGHNMAKIDPAEHGAKVSTVSQSNSPILNSAPKIVRTDGWDAKVVRRPAAITGGSSRSLDGRELSGSERWRLVRDLQTELRRVGCYSGKLDGSWGAGSKYAIRAFLQNLNSTLPTDQPDHFMLSLLRSQQGVVCGKPCQHGYTKSSSGRCLPYAITAQTPESKDGLTAPTARLVRSNGQLAGVAGSWQRRAPLEGRMAVGGPATDRAGSLYTAPGVAPPLTQSQPLARAKPLQQTRLHKPARRSGSSRARTRSKSKASRKARSYSKTARKRARRRALMRQAFGESFD